MKAYSEPEESLVETTANEPDYSRTYTAAEYLKWTFQGLYELIKGKAFKMSSPTSYHQNASGNLHWIFRTAFENKGCKIFYAPFDVYLVEEGQEYKTCKNVFQPDLCIICDLKKIKKFGCVGAPDLVVEIISPSSSKKDLKDKFELYEKYGVREYWVVSYEEKIMAIYSMENGVFKTGRPFTIADIAQSRIFPELKVDVAKIFEGIVEEED